MWSGSAPPPRYSDRRGDRRVEEAHRRLIETSVVCAQRSGHVFDCQRPGTNTEHSAAAGDRTHAKGLVFAVAYLLTAIRAE